MSQLRQLVIAAEDPVRLAGFYQEVFDLEKIEENAAAVFLSDGTFNLSLLRETSRRSKDFATWVRHHSAESNSTQLAHVETADREVHEVIPPTGSDHELHDPTVSDRYFTARV